MKITPQTATRAAGMLTMFGTPEAAAHQCGVQLRAIAPYSDRHLSAVRDALNWLAGLEGERRERNIAKLLTMHAAQ